ncbi:MAG: type II secretion system F family protein [Tatlockia sp.]|jgi:type IV pilus assembly protein PilC
MSKVNPYYWQGTHHSGATFRGIMDASCAAWVKTELYKQGITSKKICKKSPAFLASHIKPGQITLFYRQISALLKVGIPMTSALGLLIKNHRDFFMQYLLLQIKKSIENGFSLSETLQNYPSLFKRFIANLTETGEKTGKLDSILTHIADHEEASERNKKNLKKAFAYPILVLSVALLVTAALLLFVVPEFSSLFESVNAQLPFLTQLIIRLSEGCCQYGMVCLTAFGLLAGLLFSKKKSLWFHRVALKIPLLGPVWVKTIIARFSRTLALTFSAGLPVVEALQSIEGISENRVFAEALTYMREEVITGEAIGVALANTGLFPALALQLIAIGEETGNMESMLNKLADFYEEEVDHAIEAFINLLEPITMIFLGIVIGGLVIAMYLPIFKLGSVL